MFQYAKIYINEHLTGFILLGTTSLSSSTGLSAGGTE